MVDTAFETADLVLEQTYEKPLWAHACMEPLNIIVDIRDDSAKVIVGHQFPHRAAEEIERVTGIDVSRDSFRTSGPRDQGKCRDKSRPTPARISYI